MTKNSTQTPPKPLLVVGIDWADSKHDLTVLDAGKRLHFRIKSDNEDVAEMIDKLTQLACDTPKRQVKPKDIGPPA